MQRETITWAVVVIILGSTSYFCLMLGMEIGAHLAPQCTATLSQFWKVVRGARALPPDQPPAIEMSAKSGESLRSPMALLQVLTLLSSLTTAECGVGVSGFNPMFMKGDISEIPEAGLQDPIVLRRKLEEVSQRLETLTQVRCWSPQPSRVL